MKINDFYSLKFEEQNLKILDQTRLPFEENYIVTDDFRRIAQAIKRLEIRGAPLIGIGAAYGLALSVKNNPENPDTIFNEAYQTLHSTRPTAVNLFWALNEIKKVYDENRDSGGVYEKLILKAEQIHADDIKMCELMAENGLEIFVEKSNVLTHCNTGRLATGGGGTAFNVISHAWRKGKVDLVYADETRPLLQGSRLTAFELEKAGIPFQVITDSTAAFLMKQNKVDLVILGADRIARNGDTANKIGTYNLAVLCFFHNIPFYVAAPQTTIDKNCESGDKIEVEIRESKEILSFGLNPVSKSEYPAYCPAFDITPAKLISGIITDKALYRYPFHF